MANTRSLGPLHPGFAEPEPKSPSQEPLAASSLGEEQQLELYYFMKLTRMVEARLGNLYRQGKVVGGLYSSLGQEATAVATAYALEPQDFIGPLIRDLGSMLVRGVKPREVMRQYMARGDGPTGGKDGNTHFGDLERGLVAPISMLGAVIPVMAGVALAARMQGRDLVALTYIGDGGTSTGDFHEGLNFAAVQNLPLVLVVENNGWAYSTPTSKQLRAKNFASKGVGYGIPGVIVDGNDPLAVYDITRQAIDRARGGGGPTLIEAKTFRRKGHAEHDDAGYVPEEEKEYWAQRDPLDRFEHHLESQGIASAEKRAEIEARISEELDREVEASLASPLPPPERALERVYAEAGGAADGEGEGS